MPIKKVYNKIEKTFNKYILNIVASTIPHTRKHKYSDEYCLKMFKYMINDVVKWKSLSLLADYKGNPKYHYKYLCSVFNKWSKADIFKKAYTEMLKKEYFKLKHIKKAESINLFIDCTFINNMYGVDCKATNPEYKKKKCTKISAICDSENNIIALNYDLTHLSKKKNPSFCHDLNLVQKNLDEMHIQLPKKPTITLCGDKGYISQKQFKLNNNKKINIIATKRCNQKTLNTEYENNLLKKRSTVERSFSVIKKDNRVYVRKDKNIANYIGFVYLSLFDIFYKKNIVIKDETIKTNKKTNKKQINNNNT